MLQLCSNAKCAPIYNDIYLSLCNLSWDTFALSIFFFWLKHMSSLHFSGSKSLSRLDILDLDQNMINGSKLQESLRAFSSINNLTLRQNEFKGTTLSGGNNVS